MKKCILGFAFFLVILELYSQTVIPGGSVSGSWDKSGNPYLIRGDIDIPIDSALIIGQGVQVVFEGSYVFSVYGSLRMLGKTNDSIVITVSDTNIRWGGIRIFDQVGSAVDSTLLEFVIIEYALNNISGKGGGIYLENSTRVVLKDSEFRKNGAEFGGAIFFQNSPVHLIHCLIISNHAGNRGGGIYSDESAVFLEGCDIRNNNALVGGGIYFRDSDAHMNGCSVSLNLSHAGGGGVVLHEGADLMMVGCSVSGNTAHGSGGGLAILENSQSYFNYCVFEQNQSLKDQFLAFGGGVFATTFDNTIIFSNCTFKNNYSADEGGGFYSESAADIVNCLFVENENSAHVVLGGGGVFLGKKEYRILNCTFFGNKSESGTSIYLWEGDLDIFNSVIWDGVPGTGNRIFASGGSATAGLGMYSSDLEGGLMSVEQFGVVNINYGPGMLEEYPLFKDTLNGNFRIQTGSPCIDSGILDSLAILIPPTDLDSMPRVVASKIDLGAYEYQGGTFIKDAENRVDIEVYPVPFKDILFVDQGELKITKIELLTSSARIFYQEDDLTTSPAVIHTTHLPPGIYFCRVYAAGQEYTRMVVKR